MAWVEEAQTITQRSLDILRPTLRKPDSELWFTWNPRRKTDPVDKLFRGPNPPPGAIIVNANWNDNKWFPGVLETERLYDLAHNSATYEHVWEGAYATIVSGAYYAQALAQAASEARICQLAADPLPEIKAAWDLGVGDATAIWIAQFIGKQIWFLDYIEGEGQPLSYYVQELRDRGWDKALCILPHDGAHRDAVSAIRFEDHLKDAGFKTKTIANQGQGAARLRIEAMRRLFPRMWFDQDKTESGREALGAYHERRNDDREVGLGPEHDWCLASDTQVLTPTGWRAVQDISVHDQVLTPCGVRRILRSGIVRMTDKWVTVRGVKCTPEHRFFTSQGLVEAISLSPRTKLWTRGDLGLSILGFLSATLCLGLKAAITSATPVAGSSRADPCSYTAWSMRLFMAAFRRATKSIMSMTTHLTTILTISKLSPSMSTEADTSPFLATYASAVSAALSSVVTRTLERGAAPNARGSIMLGAREMTGPKPAYNLTVETDECYFVRGDYGRAYLVSNSSHGADAAGLLAIAYEEPRAHIPRTTPAVRTIESGQQNTAWMRG